MSNLVHLPTGGALSDARCRELMPARVVGWLAHHERANHGPDGPSLAKYDLPPGPCPDSLRPDMEAAAAILERAILPASQQYIETAFDEFVSLLRPLTSDQARADRARWQSAVIREILQYGYPPDVVTSGLRLAIARFGEPKSWRDLQVCFEEHLRWRRLSLDAIKMLLARPPGHGGVNARGRRHDPRDDLTPEQREASKAKFSSMVRDHQAELRAMAAEIDAKGRRAFGRGPASTKASEATRQEVIAAEDLREYQVRKTLAGIEDMQAAERAARREREARERSEGQPADPADLEPLDDPIDDLFEP